MLFFDPQFRPLRLQFYYRVVNVMLIYHLSFFFPKVGIRFGICKQVNKKLLTLLFTIVENFINKLLIIILPLNIKTNDMKIQYSNLSVHEKINLKAKRKLYAPWAYQIAAYFYTSNYHYIIE